MDYLLKMVILVLLVRVELMETQILGSVLQEPLKNLIKLFDGSYGSSNDADQKRNYDSSFRFQPHVVPDNVQPSYAIEKSVYQSGGNCSGIWSYARDARGRTIGLVTVRNPDHRENVLKLTLSLSAALPSVCSRFGDIKIGPKYTLWVYFF